MKKVILFILAITCLISFVNAQPGAIDLTFNSTDLGFGNGDGANNNINSSAIQSDGKIIIAGTFTTYNGVAIYRIARLNTDGSLDATFNIGNGADNQILKIVLQSDGKIIIVGDFVTYNGTTRNHIARINTDGTLDNSFTIGTGANASVYTTSIQTDGKIIIGGLFTSYNGTAKKYIARLNSDGSLDATFNLGTSASNAVRTMFIQSNGKIVIGGFFTTYDGISRNYIARLNSDGSLDTGFNPGTGTDTNILTCTVQSDGKVIIGGNFTSYNGTSINRIARLNSDGSLDTGFSTGTGANNTIMAVSVQSDGKIIMAGMYTAYNGTTINRIARLNSDGSVDTGFNQGIGTNNAVATTVFQSDGKIIIGGYFTSYNGITRIRIARINSNGLLDETFNILGTGANSSVHDIVVLNDDKILVGGKFTSFNGITKNNIVRLNSDGSVDNDFNLEAGANGSVNSSVIQSDGKIIIGGGFTSFNGMVANHIARLNSDGTLDGTFNTGTGTNNNAVNSVSLQSDGKIIIGGDFSTYNGTTRRMIARLNSDGTLDNSFNSGTSGGGTILTTCIQSDGKVIIGGNFTSFNGSTLNFFARDNADGTLDTDFNLGTGVNSVVNSISLLNDGRIIIGGDFISYNGTAINRIACINADGTLNTDFNVGTGTDSYVRTTRIQSDGKIILGGEFSTFNGVARNHIVRLNGDGSLDNGFNPGTGTNDYIICSTLQSDGKILIGGSFTSYNGTGRNRISRIHNNIINSSPFGPATYCAGETVSVNYTALGIYNTGNVFTAQLSDASGSFATPTVIGTLSSTLSGTIVATIPIAQIVGTGYRIRIISSDPATISVDNGSNLIVHHSSSSSLTQTACDSYELNGTTYTTSGIFTQTLVNSVGCDSVITLDLTIKQSTNNIITQAVCESFELNGTTYTSNGIYTQHLTNVAGCDSTITLNLTIKNTSSSLTETACDSYILNSQTYTSTGIYTQHLTNVVGCDSTITLDLTINNSQSAGVDSTSNVCSNETLTVDLFDHLGSTYSMGGTWNDDDATGELTGNVFNATNVIQGMNYHFTYNVTNVSPCTNSIATITLFVDICEGISMNELPSINIYPNPVKSELTIETNSDVQQSFEIINVMGQTVISSKIDKNAIVEISQLQSGVYMVKLFTEKSTIIKRFVKE